MGQPAPAESQPVYTKWWFWTIVGAAVVPGDAPEAGGPADPGDAPLPLGRIAGGQHGLAGLLGVLHVGDEQALGTDVQ